jgi:hypothetical protein
MGETAPAVSRDIFANCYVNTVTVKVPHANQGAWEAAGYDAAWVSAFRGLGNNAADTEYGTGGTEKTNITVNIVSEE